MIIKIYDKSLNALTQLISSGANAVDYNGLEYTSRLSEVGRASFIMRLDNLKATAVNLQHYNRIEIVDTDGTVRWNGVIVKKTVRINQVKIECFSALHILEKRLSSDPHNSSGASGVEVGDLITAMNATEDTKITNGVQDEPSVVDITFNRSSVLNAIRTIAGISGAQYEVDKNWKLNFKSQIGVDLSSTILFQYDSNLIQSANILEFNVEDLGTEIISKTYGKALALNSTQENGITTGKFGLLEKVRNFREPNDQATLDGMTLNANIDEQFSPKITLSPEKINDTFEVGDTISLRLKNKLIDVDTTYQIFEKQIKIVAGEKQIKVRIASRVTDLIRQIKDIKDNVDLLSREV